MLINLSNHPSDRWSAEQKEAAMTAYQQIDDLPFPNIPPEMSATEVLTLAEEYLQSIKSKAPKAVHLMGEMTFTTSLTQLLQANGIKVVASTSEREVVEEENGKKTVLFKFIQFREYPRIQGV